MTFDEWLGKDGPFLAILGITPIEIQHLELVWNAAVEEAAVVVEQRGEKIGGAIQPHKTAIAIRKLVSTNGR